MEEAVEETVDDEVGTTFALTQPNEPGYAEEGLDEPVDVETLGQTANLDATVAMDAPSYSTQQSFKPISPSFEEKTTSLSPILDARPGYKKIDYDKPIKIPPPTKIDHKAKAQYDAFMKPQSTRRLAKFSSQCWNPNGDTSKNIVLPRINSFRHAKMAKPASFYKPKSAFVPIHCHTPKGKKKKKKWISASAPLPAYDNSPYPKPALPMQDDDHSAWWRHKGHVTRVNGKVTVGLTVMGGTGAHEKPKNFHEWHHLQKIKDEYSAQPKQSYRGPIELAD